ncbi:MAG: hypothetical protein ACD_62C00127G0001 [uncultured bacterium]|nr:MAG: hypothetical protein ACD_62C00127G0001 [uncultured bacterium]
MIELQNITKSFGPQKVLDQLSLRIPEGQITVIIGRSGEGKSVLLKHMMGLLRPDAGHVIVEGVDLSKLNDYQLNETRKMFGMLFQQAALFDSMTVFENIAFPLVEHTKKPFLEVTKDVSALAAMVGLSRLALSKFPSELSGGMRKRVGLARAIALKPKILLYDEPTTGLDPIMTDVVNHLITDTQKQLHITSVVISHDIQSSFEIGDKIAMLQNGKIVLEGDAGEFQKTQNTVVKNFLSGKACQEEYTDTSV